MHYLPPALTGNNKSFPHHEPCRGHDGGPRPPLSVEREIDGGQSSPAGGMMALVESCLRILSSPLDGGLISRAPKGDGGQSSLLAHSIYLLGGGVSMAALRVDGGIGIGWNRGWLGIISMGLEAYFAPLTSLYDNAPGSIRLGSEPPVGLEVESVIIEPCITRVTRLSPF